MSIFVGHKYRRKKMKEKKTTTMIKPEFAGDIKAEIKGLAKIEDNIMEVKEYAIKLNDYYSNIVWTEDTLTDAKEEKANVNKFKDKVAEFRKNIIAEYKKPIEVFETTAKDTEKLLADTYDTINIQVKKYEDEKKEQIYQLCVDYFNEQAMSRNIDFATFDQMNVNITLGMATKTGDLTKKTKEDIEAFVERIEKDIELINAGEYVNETLVEYKQTLNASQSILDVKRRMQQIEEEKAKQEEINKQKEIEKETIKKVDETLSAPKEEEKTYSVTFKVWGTIEELKRMKEYLVNGGYKYEQQ